jgi:hypothetical protein
MPACRAFQDTPRKKTPWRDRPARRCWTRQRAPSTIDGNESWKGPAIRTASFQPGLRVPAEAFFPSREAIGGSVLPALVVPAERGEGARQGTLPRTAGVHSRSRLSLTPSPRTARVNNCRTSRTILRSQRQDHGPQHSHESVTQTGTNPHVRHPDRGSRAVQVGGAPSGRASWPHRRCRAIKHGLPAAPGLILRPSRARQHHRRHARRPRPQRRAAPLRRL